MRAPVGEILAAALRALGVEPLGEAPGGLIVSATVRTAQAVAAEKLGEPL